MTDTLVEPQTFTPDPEQAGEPAQGPAEEIKADRRRPAGKRARRRGNPVDAATVRLVLDTAARVKGASPDVRNVIARVLKVDPEVDTLTIGILAGNEQASRGLADLAGLPRTDFGQTLIALAEWEAPERVRSVWAALCALRNLAGTKLAGDNTMAAVQVAKAVTEVPGPDWTRAERAVDVLQA